MNGIRNKYPDIGPELRRRRVEAGLSLQGLADLCHYSVGHISNVENGNKAASREFVLVCDRALDAGGELAALWAASEGPTDPVSWRGPLQLPSVPRLVGRSALIAELDAALAMVSEGQSSVVVTLDGAAGSGKTTLAVTWSRRIRDSFPDGVFFYDLRGYSANSDPAEPSEVIEAFLHDLGVPPAVVPANTDRRAALLRTRLDRTRTLLVLDNASSAEQVRPLLPGSPGCLVVVTSRRRLSGLAVREGARCVTVPSFTPAEAVGLLREAIGGSRVDDEPVAARDIVRLCAHLPLAVRVAAEHVAAHPHMPLGVLAGELSAMDSRLDVLCREDEAVRAVFSWSYRALSSGAARLFRLLGLHPGERLHPHAAAALGGVPVASVTALLGELSCVHLVDEVGLDRYRQHDLLKAYAVERACEEETAAQRDAATARLLDWYLHTAGRANDAIAPRYPNPPLGAARPGVPDAPVGFTYRGAVAWCEEELGNLVAVGQLAHRVGEYGHAWRLAVVMWNFLYLRKPWTAWVAMHETGLAAARADGDVAGEAWVLNNLAQAHRERRLFDLAASELHLALRLRREVGDGVGQAWTLTGLGYLESDREDHEAAVAAFTAAVGLFEQAGDRYGEAVAVDGLGEAHRRLGSWESALENFGHALSIMRAGADRYSEGYTLTRLGSTLASLGRCAEALAHFDLALDARREIGDRWGEAETLIARGDALLARDPAAARSSWEAAVAILDELGDARVGEVRDRIDAVPRQRASGCGTGITSSASSP
ncbi:tetratricopeptide repeat protein [Saccharothrix longispora]|nr:tetratricopeptide repeat protein [Saccharothrix longispora]